MTTQHAQKVDSSEIEIIDGPRSMPLGEPEIVGLPDRRTRWAATALAIIIGIAAIATAVVFAVSALIIGAIVFTVGLVIRLAMAVSGSNHGTDASR